MNAIGKEHECQKCGEKYVRSTKNKNKSKVMNYQGSTLLNTLYKT